MTDSSTPSPKLLLVALAILVTGFPSLALADVYYQNSRAEREYVKADPFQA